MVPAEQLNFRQNMKQITGNKLSVFDQRRVMCVVLFHAGHVLAEAELHIQLGFPPVGSRFSVTDGAIG